MHESRSDLVLPACRGALHPPTPLLPRGSGAACREDETVPDFSFPLSIML